MAKRPSFFDLNAKSLDPASRLGLPSPHLLYNDGQILSPLDAFAAQSWMMAKQLDIKEAGEKRISRLPPAVVTKSLSQHRADRPIVFRSLSQESSGSRGREDDGPGSSPQIAHPPNRPRSQHPRISAVFPSHGDGAYEDEGYVTPEDRPSPSTTTYHSVPPSNYFALPRTASPVPTSTLAGPGVAQIQARAEMDPPTGVRGQGIRPRNNSSNSQLDPNSTISPRLRPALYHESSDDDYTSSIAGSSSSYLRKLSSSSGISAPQSPLSPFIPIYPPRSPSINSETSMTGASLARPQLNFSRPRSNASLSIPNRADSPVPKQSIDLSTQPPSATIQDTPQAPLQAEDVEEIDTEGPLAGAGSSYTYASFSLPRGRIVSRNSAIFQGISTPHFEWKEPPFRDLSLPQASSNTSSSRPPMQPRVSLDPKVDQSEGDRATFAFGFEPAPVVQQDGQDGRDGRLPKWSSTSASNSHPSTRSVNAVKSSENRPSGDPADLASVGGPREPKTEADDARSTSSKSNSTVRAVSTAPPQANHHSLSPEEHVTKAIECHENGSLPESTYHLRVAAMQNHPTAMLLYALACRHGWGMRRNQREGVQWLRKALDSAMIEVAEDEGPAGPAGAREAHDKKAKRAHFALSIYELGVSHLNGWGIEQDKVLALRCFEVAGHWGDVDALSEAGFCYVEGIGCKKDLRKAAKFYRMAEQKGVSMVGNSWIYKDKYKDEHENEVTRSRPPTMSSPGQEKKRRDKSRTRSIFGRKKSYRAE